MAGRRRRKSVRELFFGAVTVGERGQVVIPAEARKAYGLRPGEKLLVFGHPHGPGITLARLEEVQGILEELRRMHELISAAGQAGPEEGKRGARGRSASGGLR